MEHFWPLQKEPLGYIAMNEHRGPLVKASGRAEYEVLVPIFGLMPQDKDVLNQNVEVVSRVYDHNLIAVWMWPELDRKFIAKLAPWPYGHYNQVIFEGLDDIIDDIVTEDFEDGSFSQIYTDDHTTASFQQHYQHNAYGFVPSSSKLGLALVPAMLPISPLALVPSQAPTSDDFVTVDELILPQIIKLSEDLRWTTRSAPDGNSHCQSILADLPVDHPWSLIVSTRQSAQIPPDLTAYAQALLTTLPSQTLIPYIHPTFFSLHNMQLEAGTVGEQGVIWPTPLPLTSERLERHGLYLIEDGQTIFLWIGRDAVPQLVMDVFNLPNFEVLRGGKTTLPVLDNDFSQRVNAIIQNRGVLLSPSLCCQRERRAPFEALGP
ncbi:hypothetical protein EDD22DRAFT_1021159 [Suillus occidentalis]|nr:hypothetical protein EDD22DRAFT_1021159 [Suillus occidentalis]